MINVLFVGNYLSKSKGTLGVSEQIALALPSKLITVRLTSRKQNQILRLLDIIFACFIYSYQKIQIDTYSGKAFIIAEVASYIAKTKGVQPILTLHGGMLPEFYQKNQLRVKRVFNRASYIQTPSLYLQEFFQKQGFPINYLPNPIRIENFPYKRDRVKPHSLLWVRAFTEIYNPDLAIKALVEVRKHYPDTTLTMIGPDKGLLNKSRRLINELGLDKAIDIIGPVKNDLLFQYYQTHEVFLNTTRYESFGVAVVEAAACGIPVVSTKVGEIPFLWEHEENILLVDGFSVIDFAGEIKKLQESKKLAEKISTNARVRAASFDWNVVRQKWIELLSS